MSDITVSLCGRDSEPVDISLRKSATRRLTCGYAVSVVSSSTLVAVLGDPGFRSQGPSTFGQRPVPPRPAECAASPREGALRALIFERFALSRPAKSAGSDRRGGRGREVELDSLDGRGLRFGSVWCGRDGEERAMICDLCWAPIYDDDDTTWEAYCGHVLIVCRECNEGLMNRLVARRHQLDRVCQRGGLSVTTDRVD